MRTACINPSRLYQARLAKGLTQADVAYSIRTHGHKANERSIRRWESGQHAPHANVVPALAEALGVTIESLYEQTEGAAEDEEDEAALRRIAHQLIDQDENGLAADLLTQVQRMKAKREVRA